MTTYKKIMNIALPAMAENFSQMLMGMVDSYLVASLGLLFPVSSPRLWLRGTRSVWPIIQLRLSS